MTPRAALIATALAYTACAPVARAPDAGALQPLAEIPIELRHGMPTVDVTVGGAPLRLFLDLAGYQPIALTAAEIGRVKIDLLPEVTRFRNSEGEVLEARQFMARAVAIAGFDVGDLQGGESIPGRSAPPDGNGYIGRPVLQRFLLVLDYPNRRVRFYASGNDAAMRGECGSRRFRIDLADGIVRSVADTEFGPRLFVWDTGTTHNFIRPSVLPAGMTGTKIDDGGPVIEIEHVRLDGHDVGPQQFRLVPFGAPAVDGFLGAGLLSSHKVCLDVGRNVGAIV